MFETWSRSRNYLFNKYGIYCGQSGGCLDEENPPLRRISYGNFCRVQYSFKWQNMTGAGAGAGTEFIDKDVAGAENK